MTRSLRTVTKQYVLPAEHGGWFLWLGPFILGAMAAAQYNLDLLLLLFLTIAIFLGRQPLVIMTKALAGRRGREEIGLALRVFGVIALVAAALLAVLMWRGHIYLLGLALPAVPVLAAQLWLVSRRRERQVGIELVGAGVLALAAPAAYWVSVGSSDTEGWWLWALSWLYSASAIIYVYLRLQQRRWTAVPNWDIRWQKGTRVLLVAGFNLLLVLMLSTVGYIPPLTFVAYLLALLHYSYGVAVPCLNVRPARVGIEQSLAMLAFFLILALAFRIG